ncbi:MAG: ATP-binding protein [Kiritimatiellia bacterium]|jgi:PAS domain S-box-containing protein
MSNTFQDDAMSGDEIRAHDLREARAALDAANRRRAELESIINKSPAMVFLWRAAPGWPVEFVSDSIRQLGFTPDDFLAGGMPFSQIVHPADLIRVGREVEGYSASGVDEFEQQYRIFNKRGEVRWIDDRTWIRRDEHGTITHYQGIVMDITDRKLADERQVATQDGLRAVLTMADRLIAATGDEDLYRGAVELTRAQLGLERTAIMLLEGESIRGTFGTNLKGQTTTESAHVMPMDEKWRERLRPRKAGERPWIIIHEQHFEWDGKEMVGHNKGWVALTPIFSGPKAIGFFCNDATISGGPVDEVKQEVVAVFCAFLGNIIARRKAEAEQDIIQEQHRELMERADRLNSLGMLAAGMAHEINNPLQGMISHLHTVQRLVQDDERAANSLRMVERGIDSIASLVRKLLILGRSTDEESEMVDCREATEFVIQLLASQFARDKVTIQTTFTGKQIMAALPRRYLTQVLLNLLINARDAMPNGGRIHLGVRKDGGMAVMSISDEGTGIPPERMDQIFKPFYTTKGATGSGLGLSVADSLVRAVSGVIDVESEPGKTVFTLRVPLARRS